MTRGKYGQMTARQYEMRSSDLVRSMVDQLRQSERGRRAVEAEAAKVPGLQAQIMELRRQIEFAETPLNQKMGKLVSDLREQEERHGSERRRIEKLVTKLMIQEGQLELAEWQEMASLVHRGIGFFLERAHIKAGVW